MAQKKKPTVLGKDQILSAEDLNRELVEVPEWGGSVYVQAMSGVERDAYEASIIEINEDAKGNVTTKRRMENLRAKMVARCMVGEDGERLFDESEIEALGAKSAKALDRVFSVAQKLNGVSDKDLEELAGN